MDLTKINLWIAGSALIVAGSLAIYFEDYKNNYLVSTIAYITVLGGWIVLFIRAVKGTSLDEQTDEFKKQNPEPLKVRLTRLLAIGLLLAVMFGGFYLVSNLATERREMILKTQPTDTTTATIAGIQVRRGRNSTSYYAIFEYKVGDKVIDHPRYEDKGDFLTGDKYEIRYSVKYPEMFKIIGKWRYDIPNQ